MIVTAVKTHVITEKDTSITDVVGRYITNLSEMSIVAVTSKIVSICEGRVVEGDEHIRDELVPQESEWYIPREYNSYGFCYTITNNNLIASAGIDQSNGNGKLVLWPKDLQKTTNDIREYLCRTFNRQSIGVIITDSHTQPLKWGVVGTAIAHSGFQALNDYVGKPDLFGRLFKVEKLSVRESLAVSAVAVMGEGSEQTPLAVISDVPFVSFQNRNPTKEEVDSLAISREEDLFWPIMKNAPWKKGKK